MVWRRRLALFTLGAVISPIGDSFHIHSGATAYDCCMTLLIGESPWWFYLPVALGVAVAGDAAAWLQSHLGPGRVTVARAVCAVAAVLAVWWGSAWLPDREGAAVTVTLYAMAALSWALFDRSRAALVLAAVAAVVGTSVEMIQSALGRFHYDPPLQQVAGVPFWLPAIYLAAGVAIARLTPLLSRRIRAAEAPGGAL